MPELPEVEVLVRHLRPLLRNRTIEAVEVRRARSVRPTDVRTFAQSLLGARFKTLRRRGKYLVFGIESARANGPQALLGHLGMTGRMYLLPGDSPPPKHTAVALGLGGEQFIFEDTRYFGRFTLDLSPLDFLGPEPLGRGFTARKLQAGLECSSQPIKVKLLDQSLVAGIGNIYASEALFRAGISPRTAAASLRPEAVRRLWKAIRATLTQAIEFGSTVPLDYAGAAQQAGLFYYGTAVPASDFYEERLQVYDRAGRPCLKCGSTLRRIVQAARSSFFCPKCQT